MKNQYYYTSNSYMNLKNNGKKRININNYSYIQKNNNDSTINKKHFPYKTDSEEISELLSNQNENIIPNQKYANLNDRTIFLPSELRKIQNINNKNKQKKEESCSFYGSIYQQRHKYNDTSDRIFGIRNKLIKKMSSENELKNIIRYNSINKFHCNNHKYDKNQINTNLKTFYRKSKSLNMHCK